MLHWRLTLGALLIAALGLFCWLDQVTRPGAFLLPLALMLSWFGVVELLDIFDKRGRLPLPWAMYAGVLLTVLLAAMPVIWPSGMNGPFGRLGWLALGLAAGVLIAMIGELQRYDGRWQSSINLGLSMFAVVYLGGFMGFMVQLRLLGGDPWGDDGSWGMLALLSLVVTVKMSDIGQFTVGRLIGRHKLAPLVSPGKTWEGAIGGLLFAVAAAWFVFGWLARWIPATSAYGDRFLDSAARPTGVTVFALVVAIAGMIGDLAESMLKRDAGVKDSSTWLPGFGGVLDLLDSLLVAAPVAYVCWVLRLVGP